ncbi:MAG: dihydroorotate dehydrogenase electron transfer subunit [Muribaculaceae bacterium]|nr:dihydroorotate dehydrogenase electron transfer subunit [Muribaculaceae bacterium]
MKNILDLKVVKCEKVSKNFALLQLCAIDAEMPEMHPGQFVQVAIDGSKSTFLRRPISICNVEDGNLWLLVRNAGEGTAWLISRQPGDIVNVILPLGNGFDMDIAPGKSILLMGGGVGVAPLLYYGKRLKEQGASPEFLLAAKTSNDLMLMDEFEKYGVVHISTDDGSKGEKGLITQNSVLQKKKYDKIACCGPMPMMKAVASYAIKNDISCEVSLENLMACGVGACLCCVEDTIDMGHICVCKEGPVLNIKRLKWEI